MEGIKTHFKKNISIYAILALGLVFSSWFDYKNNLIAIGGDSIIPLDPINNLKFLYKWIELDNGSEGNLSNLFLYSLFALMQKIGLTLAYSHFIYTYLIHILGAFGMYYLCYAIFKEHIDRKKISFLAASIYMFTPATFNMNFIYGLYATLPFILAFFIEGLKKKSYILYPSLIGIGFFIGCLPDPHPRSFVITFLVLFFYSIFEIITKKNIKEVAIFSAISACIVFLINAWFFAPYLYNIFMPNYISSIATNVPIVRGTKFLDEGTATIGRMFRLFSNNLNFPTVKQIEYLSNIFVTVANYLYPLLAFGLLLFLFSNRRKTELPKRKLFFLIFLAIIFLFLAKGTNPPFGSIYEWSLINIPLFRIFRTTAYIILVASISYSVLISFSVLHISHYFQKKLSKIIFFVFILILIVINSYPLLFGYPTLNLGNIHQTDNKHGIKIPSEYRETNDFLEKKLSSNKTIYFPLVSSYEELEFGYFGISPIIFSLNKPLVISAVSSSLNNQSFALQNIIYDEINEQRESGEILAGLSNIKYVIVNKYVSATKDNLIDEKTEKLFDFVENFGNLSLYKVNEKYYLPHFYTSRNIIFSKRTIEEISRITSLDNHNACSIIYFENQISENRDAINKINSDKENGKLPILEFKKINPTKYRIRVHNAKATFPLVFSESFHDGWKAYLVSPKPKNENLKFQFKNQYKIFDDNLDEQSSMEELKEYLDNGWVTDLGDGKEKEINHNKWDEKNQKEKLDYKEKYSIGFISKKIQGTIQNDNLSKGNVWETWFQTPLSKDSHLVANGYANSWVLDTNNLCQQFESGYCIKNPDGSYDFEMVVEFWPQRLFYIGLFISGITLLACLVYLSYNWKINRSKIEEANGKGIE